jgi:cytochrome c peroxidase
VTGSCGMNALIAGAVTIIATLNADKPGAEETSAALTPQALKEIAQVEAEIDRIEAQTLQRLAVRPDNQVQQIELLGKLMLYDKHLSMNRNEACAPTGSCPSTSSKSRHATRASTGDPEPAAKGAAKGALRLVADLSLDFAHRICGNAAFLFSP